MDKQRDYIMKLIYDLIDDENITEERLIQLYEEKKIINKTELQLSLDYYFRKEGKKNVKRN